VTHPESKSVTSPISHRQFLLGATLSSLIAIVYAKALGFAESVVVARILGGREFGLLTLVLSITSLVVALSTLGIPSALTKFLSGEASASQTAARKTLAVSLRVVILSTFVASVCSIAVTVSVLGSYYQAPEAAPLILTGIVVAGISSPILLFANALQGLKQVTRLNVLTMIAGTAGLVLAVLLSLAWGVQGAVIAFLVVAALPGILSIRFVRSSIRSLPNIDGRGMIAPRALLNYGLPTVVSGLIVLSATYLLNSWLAVGIGLSDLGDFAVASSLAAAIGFIPAAIGVPLVPVLSSLSVDDPQRGRAVVPRVMRVITFVSVSLGVLMISFAPEILAATYGPEYSAAALPLVVLTLASTLAATTGVVGSHIAGAGRMWLGLGVNVVWSTTIVVAGFQLIPRYGAIGAGVSMLVGYGVLAMAILALGARRLGLNYTGMGGPAIWSSFALTLAVLASTQSSNYRLPAAIIIVIAVICTALILLRPDERALVRDAIALASRNRRTQ